MEHSNHWNGFGTIVNTQSMNAQTNCINSRELVFMSLQNSEDNQQRTRRHNPTSKNVKQSFLPCYLNGNLFQRHDKNGKHHERTSADNSTSKSNGNASTARAHAISPYTANFKKREWHHFSDQNPNDKFCQSSWNLVYSLCSRSRFAVTVNQPLNEL